MLATVMTSDGDLIDTLNPDPSLIKMRVIAHHLSRQCRYNGACDQFYSVAEHCILGHDLMMHKFNDQNLAAAFLLHDAHEAFIGDIITPMKPLLVDSPWWHAADALDLAIQERFDVSFDDRRIKQVDDHMLASEWWFNMPHPEKYLDKRMTGWDITEPVYLSPDAAREQFLLRTLGWWP